MSARLANLLSVAALGCLAATIALTAPRWARHFRQPLTPLEDDRGTPASSATPIPAASDGAERRISVKLFFESAERPGLMMEERAVTFSTDLSRQIRSVLEEIVRGSQQNLLPTLDPQTRILDVFVTARGIAYVDLSKEASQAFVAGSDDELLAVYSVVDSITANFPAVRRVQILIDDHPVETLSGHVDLSRPLPADLTVLTDTFTPSPEPSATPNGPKTS